MTLRDQQARDAIAQVLDQNMMVLAGAGAGKTYALVQRMVNAVQMGVVGVDQLAAITFTRKAAGEMRGRFFSALKARAEEAEGKALGRVQWALKKVDQCFIGTIHAFCGQLLRERPVEAGLPPDFSEVEEREEAVIRREAWDRFVQNCFLAKMHASRDLKNSACARKICMAFFKDAVNSATYRSRQGPRTSPIYRPQFQNLRPSWHMLARISRIHCPANATVSKLH